jgi:hypothetical protein
LKITGVRPNHGWRHRFSSLARAVDMHVDIQNVIQGHVGKKTAGNYGDAWVEVAKREISKIPAYRITADRRTPNAGRVEGRIDDVEKKGPNALRDGPLFDDFFGKVRQTSIERT